MPAGPGWQTGVIQEFQASMCVDAEAGDRGAAGIGGVNVAAIIRESQPTRRRLLRRHFPADDGQTARVRELVGGDRAAIRGAGGGLGNEEPIAAAGGETE